MQVRWWSSTASVVLVAFLVVGVFLLATGSVPGGVLCLILAAVYVPARLLRGYLAAKSQQRGTRR